METIESAITDIKDGKFVVVVDDENRENEGDVVIAAEKITPASVNFMITHCRGLICVSLPSKRLAELKLDQMVIDNSDSYQTKFTVSVDSIKNTTGISAYDRADTILDLVTPQKTHLDFRRPGHIFPVSYQKGGVLKRGGHTEASLDLVILAGLEKGAVICEILKNDGSMARREDLHTFCLEHQLKMISISDLIRYRLKTDTSVEKKSETFVRTPHGEFKCLTYANITNDFIHVVLVKGEVAKKKNVLTRVHTENIAADLFELEGVKNTGVFNRSLKAIAEQGEGVLVYLRKHGYGENIIEDLSCFERKGSTNQGHLDSKGYGIGACILRDLGLTSLRLLTNNQHAIHGLEGYGLEITEKISLEKMPVEEVSDLKLKVV